MRAARGGGIARGEKMECAGNAPHSHGNYSTSVVNLFYRKTLAQFSTNGVSLHQNDSTERTINRSR